jgi:hypothetical protein
VLHFLQKHLLLAQQLLGALQQAFLLAFDRAARGDVGEGQQDRGVWTGLVDHHAGVQQHGALAQAREVVLDLEAVHRRVFRDDGLEQDPKGGDVPLPVAQVVEQAAHGVLRIDLKDLVEGTAGRQDDEAPVQHQKRLVDRIDDRLGERLGVFNSGDLARHRGWIPILGAATIADGSGSMPMA